MSETLRVGIVGCGEVAQIIHMPTLQNLRDRFSVTAICDVSARVLEGVGEQFGVRHRFRDYRELVGSAEVDAVLVANPHVFHAEVAMAAMRAGKHVLVEKPMCMSLAEADALIAQEKQSGIVTQVGFMRRYSQAFTEAKALIQGMTDIRLARVHDVIGRNPLIITQINNVIRPTDLPEGAEEELLAKQTEMVRAALGPVPEPLDKTYLLLLGLASHDVSAMRELLGTPKGILYAAARGPEGRTVSAAFDYGAFVCQFETTVDAIPRFDAHIEVYGPNTVIRVEYDTPYVRNLPGRMTVIEPGPDGTAQRHVKSTWRDAFEIEWLAFHENVSRRRRPKTSLEDAREDLVLFRQMMTLIRAGGAAAENREGVVPAA